MPIINRVPDPRIGDCYRSNFRNQGKEATMILFLLRSCAIFPLPNQDYLFSNLQAILLSYPNFRVRTLLQSQSCRPSDIASKARADF